MPGKRIQFDDDVLDALKVLGSDRMATLQDLADEAFADLLKKHSRHLDQKSALQHSLANRARTAAALSRGKKPARSAGI